MSDIFCVTNRRLCTEDFLRRIERIAQGLPDGIILREKDMPEGEYRTLAESVMSICRNYHVPCILHSFGTVARALACPAVHMPLPLLRGMSAAEKCFFNVLGSSCHSVAEAQEAAQLGCTYITAGHVFATACKKGVAPRGTAFLDSVCDSVSLPVYAIGGIDCATVESLNATKAAGFCIMSALMTCADPALYIKTLRNTVQKNRAVLYDAGNKTAQQRAVVP